MFGVAIAEPMTVVTDYAIAVICGWFAARLFFSEHNRQHFSCRAWAIGFLFTGLGFLLGGTGHGFALYMSSSAMSMIWKFAFFAAGLSMAAFVAGTVTGSVSARGWRSVFHGLNALGLLTFATLVAISDDNFLLVIIVTVVSLGFIALIQGWVFVTQKSKSAKWMIAGVLIYFLSAAIQQSGFDLHLYFNHNDLYHVVLIVGLYLLFRGAEQLQDNK
jgi:hypothetical protein